MSAPRDSPRRLALAALALLLAVPLVLLALAAPVVVLWVRLRPGAPPWLPRLDALAAALPAGSSVAWLVLLVVLAGLGVALYRAATGGMATASAAAGDDPALDEN